VEARAWAHSAHANFACVACIASIIRVARAALARILVRAAARSAVAFGPRCAFLAVTTISPLNGA